MCLIKTSTSTTTEVGTAALLLNKKLNICKSNYSEGVAKAFGEVYLRTEAPFRFLLGNVRLF